jgi:hypothetical protein
MHKDVAPVSDARDAPCTEPPHIGRLGAVFAARPEDRQLAFDAGEAAPRFAKCVGARLNTGKDFSIDGERTVEIEHEVGDVQRAEPRYIDAQRELSGKPNSALVLA